MILKPLFRHLSMAALALTSALSQATIVEFQTSHGNIQVNLHDESTPKTVENFLTYVNNSDYVDTVIHRVEPNFVVQGGGFKYDGDISLDPISTRGSVDNEPLWSNVKGTIAMAKVSGNANSATSQWFFNLENNSANLDLQNGGFTVFGQVIGDGMDVLEAIEDVPLCNSTPIENYTSEQCSNNDVPAYEDFVTIYNIVVVDSSTSTDGDLDKTPNTLINQPDPDDGGNGGSSSGGSFAWMSAVMLLVLGRRFTKK
ncbi:peptidylprolyl isomerase [Thalassotalea atypica]|uniref:peptidylprolyl isomerase n=1 Tax=Thalassotalea atypica TaxID=2054316 RepID=UPI0025729073|nr:peptidylprolyl isomerase [Thalassotalea atypica]